MHTLVVMDLVHRVCGVQDVGLVHGALNHRLDVLVHMVVNVLASHGLAHARGMQLGSHIRCIPELCLFSLQRLVGALVITVAELARLLVRNCVRMRGWDVGLVANRLNCGVVVVLMDLAINDALVLVMLGGCNMLLDHGRLDCFVDCSICLSVVT